MVEIQGPDDDSQPGSGLAPTTSSDERNRLDLEGRLTSLAYGLDGMRRQMDATTERTARIEGVISALFGALESLRGDYRDLTGRTEQRVLRGLEFLDSRLAHSRESARLPQDAATTLSDAIANAVDTLRSQVTNSTARLEAKLGEVGSNQSVEAIIRAQGDEAAHAAQRLESLADGLWTAHAQQAQAVETLKSKLSDLEQGAVRDFEKLDSRMARSEDAGRGTRESVVALSDKLTSAIDDLKSESAAGIARLELKLAEESRTTESTRDLIRDHSDTLAASSAKLQEMHAKALQEFEGKLAEAEESLGARIEAVGRIAADANEQSDDVGEQLVSRLQHSEARLSRQIEAAAKALESVQSLLRGQSIADEETVRRIEEALAAAAERDESRAQFTAAIQEQQELNLRAVEDKLENVEKTILRHLDGTGRDSIQSAERSTKTLEALIAGLERLDSRFSHQVGSSEHALHGALAELERRLTQQVSEAVQSIEARFRQREETLVRLIVGGGLETPESQ